MKKIHSLIASSVALVAPAHAHVASVNAGKTSGPVLTESAQTLEQGKSAIGLTYQHVDLDGFSGQELIDIAEAGFEEVHNTDAIQISSFHVSHGVTDRLELSVLLPLISRTNIAEGELEDGEGEIETLGDSFGVGDIMLRARYHLLSQEHAAADLGLGVAIKAPTGETGEREDEGGSFETEFQPGSGSFDYDFSIAAGRDFGPWAINAAAEYTLVTEGAQDTNLGDTFTASTAVSRGWDVSGGHNLTLIAELLYIDQEAERIGDETDINSGGRQLFIAPGARFNTRQGFGIFASLAFAIDEDLNGIQNETDLRLTAGLGWTF